MNFREFEELREKNRREHQKLIDDIRGNIRQIERNHRRIRILIVVITVLVAFNVALTIYRHLQH